MAQISAIRDLHRSIDRREPEQAAQVPGRSVGEVRCWSMRVLLSLRTGRPPRTPLVRGDARSLSHALPSAGRHGPTSLLDRGAAVERAGVRDGSYYLGDADVSDEEYAEILAQHYADRREGSRSPCRCALAPSRTTAPGEPSTVRVVPAQSHSIDTISCTCYITVVWEIELSHEVVQWYVGLKVRDRAFTDRALDRLALLGPALSMPHSRMLGAGLRELRFSCEGVARRVTYYIDSERKVITLTTFRKQRDNERREVDRAHRAMGEDRMGREDR